MDSVSASLHYLVYSFHMALFFACSGFLLYPKLNIEGVFCEISKRFKRLMIPYFFLSFLYLGGKLIGGGLADNQLTDNPFIAILFGSSPCFGAWFLWVLFVMTLITLCLRRINLWALFGMAFLISFIPINYGENCMGLDKTQENMMWLIFGCLVRKYYHLISQRINIRIGLLAAIILIVIHMNGRYFADMSFVIQHSLVIIKTLSGITASFVFCYLLASRSSTSLVSKAFKLCGDYCMDIYILSMFVLVPLRIVYVNLGGMNYIPYYLWLLTATILGVLLPIIASKYVVRKTKILKMLLLGG